MLVLPYIEEEQLFKEFRLDEPWDSPHNLALLSRMPKVYAPFNGAPTPEPFTTHYRVFTGEGTAFEGNSGVSLEDFGDGTSNTLLIVEAAEAVPWTKPDELPYAADRPLPRLGGLFKDRFNVLIADGGVRSFRYGIGEATLRAAITRNGGEVPGPDWDDFR